MGWRPGLTGACLERDRRLADRGQDVSAFLANRGRVMGRCSERDFAMVMKTLLRQAPDQHYLRVTTADSSSRRKNKNA